MSDWSSHPGGTARRRRGGAAAGRRRLAIRLAKLGVAAVCVWLIGLAGFAHHAGNYATPGPERTDAIVVLTGGSGRISHGVRLLESGRADRLFISGVYQGVEVAELLALARGADSALTECCIQIGYTAQTTEGNARETAQWVAEQGLASLRIVTANYHMARSVMEFRAAMPNVTLIADPVAPRHVRLERWWGWPGTTRLIIGEYNKYLVAWLRLRVT